MTAAGIGVGYDGSDFYCDVALRHVDQLDVVHHDERVLAFHHTKPYWQPVHIVVIPTRHISSLLTVTADDAEDVRALLAVVQRIATDIERHYGAARILTNVGRYQDSKHLHVHVASGASPRPDPL